MADAEAKAPSTATASPRSRKSSFILLVVAIVMILDFVSFASFWMGRAVSAGDWNRIDQNLRSAVWPEFLSEAEFFAAQDMPTVNALLDKYLSIDRRNFGNGGPFVDYFFLKAFRVTGFFTLFAGGMILIAFAGAEAYKRNKEKQRNFVKRSATAYHFTLFAGCVFGTSFFFIYVFMPGKIVIPGLIKTAVPFMLYSPYFWMAIMVLIAGCTVYGMISNITNA